jgi:putative Ca2+/H+ antiporter (TMEM165/GDT1 family)
LLLIKSLIQMARFGAVGLLNTMAGLGVMYGCMFFFGAGVEIANMLGYGVGVCLSFQLNKRWTFSSARPIGQAAPRFGVFLTTVLAFFLAEMGDKTQIATVMLAAQYNAWATVVAGTTLGMMLANAPVVWLGDAITRRVPLRMVHIVSAVIFMVLGGVALLGWA